MQIENEEQFNRYRTQVAQQEYPGVLATITPARQGGTNPIPAVMKFYSRLDFLMGKAEQRLACKDGCSYCCNYHVYIFAAEAFAMVEAMRRLPDATREAITRSIHLNLETIKPLSVDEYIHTNIPCAFLVDGGCSVYAARPTACRHHHSVDGISCKITFDNPISQVQSEQSPEHLAITTAMISAFQTAQHSTGMDIVRYELHSAVLEAMGNPSAMKRWRAGKITFPSVKDRAMPDRREA